MDDLIVFNNKKFFNYLKEIYPSELTVQKANKSDHLADYLDLTFIIDSDNHSDSDDQEVSFQSGYMTNAMIFDFHIVNFPFRSSNKPSGPSYGVHISQLIKYA